VHGRAAPGSTAERRSDWPAAAEHRTDLGVGLHHRPHRIGRAHHDQVQAIQQQGLIADTAQQIGSTVSIGL